MDICCKENVLNIAEKAGYGMQINATASDGVHCDCFEKELWGGCMETQRIMVFAKLIVEQARQEWEIEQERKLTFASAE